MQSLRSTVCFLGAVVLSMGLVFPAYAGGPDPITIGISDGATNPGDTVEVLVSLDAGDTSPSTLVIFIKYDPTKLEPAGDFFEFTFVDGNGDPVLDSEGNTVTFRSIVRTESSLLGLNKAIDTEVHGQGVLGVAIQGGTSQIPDGPLFTAAFRVLGGAVPGEFLALNGLDEDEGEPIEGSTGLFFSSAAYSPNGQPAQPIEVNHADGTVEVNCVPVAEQPQNVAASQGNPDAVVVSWDAVASPGAEYRVFRSDDQNLANAAPLGSAWQTATFFNDITALVPEPGAAGCACNAQVNVNNHFYWVQARTAQGCEGDFSSPPVLGFRGTAKAASATASTKAQVFPASTNAGGIITIATNAQIALRVEGGLPVDASIVASSAATTDVLPANADGTAWWVIATPVPEWADGETITLSAGGAVRVYVADAAVATEKRGNQAIAIDFAPEGSATWLPEGVGRAYTVGPEGVFAVPQTVWIPAPADEDAEELVLYVWRESDGVRGWFYAIQVDGLVADSLQYRETAEGTEIGVTLRHSATVQLGHPVQPSTHAAATVVPLTFGQLFRSSGGAMITLMCSLLVLVWSRYRLGRTGKISSAGVAKTIGH